MHSSNQSRESLYFCKTDEWKQTVQLNQRIIITKLRKLLQNQSNQQNIIFFNFFFYFNHSSWIRINSQKKLFSLILSEAFFKDFVREIISLLVESQHVSFSVSFDIETTISFNLINDTIETWKTWALSMINEIERLYELNIQRQDELKQRLKEIKELKAMIKA